MSTKILFLDLRFKYQIGFKNENRFGGFRKEVVLSLKTFIH